MTAYLVIREGSKWTDVFRLVDGESVTIGRAPTNLKIISAIYSNPGMFAVRGDNPAKQLRDLVGKPIAWGTRASGLTLLGRYVTDGLALAQRSGQAMADSIGDAFPVLPLPTGVRRDLRDAVAAALATGEVPTVLARAWNDGIDDLDRTL